jgi:2-dehydropantoate 2-reductase
VLTEPIVIWGAGAIGGTIGAHLVRAGHIVRFVDIVPDHVLAMRAGGLRITGPIADFRVEVDAVLPDDLTERISTVLLCVKAHHTAEAVRMLAPRLSPDGVVVSVQNGLNEPVIADVVGATRTFACFVNFGADYIEPGLIHYGGRGTVAAGELDGRATPRSAAIHALFHSFDARAILSDNIFGYLWSKLAYASMLFATALSDEGIADALDRPPHRPMYAALAHEVVRAATAEGIRLEPFDGFEPAAYANPFETRPVASASPSGSPASRGAMTAEAMESLDALVAHNRRSAKVHSGIWRDLAIRRRPTEVDAQLGPVVDAAARHGIAAPLNRRLIEMIHEVERGERRQTHANLDELTGVRLQPGRASRPDGFGGTRAEAGGPSGGDS